MNCAPIPGRKARHVIAWAGASPTSGGPGTRSQKLFPGLKGRNNSSPDIAPNISPLQGGGEGRTDVFLGLHPRLSHDGLSALPKLRAATADAEKATLQNRSRKRGTTGQQIDALVYDLYGLTESEIQLVEGGQ